MRGLRGAAILGPIETVSTEEATMRLDLSPLPPAAPPRPDATSARAATAALHADALHADARPGGDADRDAACAPDGWLESSLALRRGLDVVEYEACLNRAG